MLQNATSNEFTTFPSTPEDKFRSLHSTTTTEVETIENRTFAAADAEFRVADGRSISGVFFGISGFLDDSGALLSQVEDAQNDIDTFKDEVLAWYTDASSALREIRAAAEAEAAA